MTRRFAVAAVGLAAIAVFADMYLTQPILPLLGHLYGVSPAVAGETISVVVFAIAFASSAYGPIAAILGQKRVMVAGCALLAVATLLCAFSPSFGALLVLRGLQGLLVPAVSALAVPFLGVLSEGEPAPLVGIYIGASVAGGLLGRVGGGALAGATSWRVSFVAFAVVTLAAALAMWFALPASPPSRRDRELLPLIASEYRSMGGHFSDPRLTGAYVVGAALFFGFVGLFTYLPYLLTSPPFALSTGSVSWFYAAYLAGIVTAPLTGRFAGRLSRKLLMAAGFVVAMLGMLLTKVPSLGAVVAGTIVVCVGTFIAQAIAPAYVNTVATSAKGSANALYQTFYYLGAVFGSTLPGLAYERFGWSGTIGSCVASLAVGLLAALLFCGDDDRPIENDARRRQRSAGGAHANVDSGQSAL